MRNSRWEGNEHWFKFDHNAGLKRFDEISSLSSTSTTIALRALKYHLENEMCLEISDDLFVDIFRKVCSFSPVLALGGYAILEFIQPLQRILERYGVSKDKVGAIWKTFRVRVNNPRSYRNIPHSSKVFPEYSHHS